ncbi:MAG: AEC family transporter [Gammaproteobacteria bacterium]|nr:AEC family transporter [Gammaproteobacteria bacterium]
MYAILIAIVPLLSLIALGFALGRFNFINAAQLAGLSKLTFTAFIPCLLFLSIYQSEDLSSVSFDLLFAFYFPVITLFVLSFIVYRQFFSRSFEKSELLSLATTFSNNVLIGIPILLGLIGEKILLPAFVIVSIHSLILFSLTSFFAGFRAASEQSWYRTVAMSLWITTRSPIVLSLMLGLLFKWLDVPVHELIIIPLTFLKEAALPCALLVLGLTLSQYKTESNLKLTTSVLFAKLILLPFCIYLSASALFSLPDWLVAVTVVLSASPVGLNVFMFASQDSQASPYLASAILTSTLLSILTVPLWLIWLGLT